MPYCVLYDSLYSDTDVCVLPNSSASGDVQLKDIEKSKQSDLETQMNTEKDR